MSLTIRDGGTITKDPADIRVYTVDWNVLGALAPDVAIVTSTWTITAITPAGDTALTKDQATILDDDRRTQLRLTGGTLGARYRIDNTIVTDEVPAQTIERSFYVRIATQ